MRPKNLQTRIFLDGGDPEETRTIMNLLGFLDGQTTNPTLIAKNPEARKRLEEGKKFSEQEILSFYRNVVTTLSGLLPEGSVSVEVYADAATTASAMLMQGREMFSWIPNAHIKFPTSHEGLKAAELAVKEGLRVNMTLCFSQEQAAAVYAATRGAKKGQVFISPFVGRLDDRGENGMDLVANIIKMYGKGDGHVEVLAASVRNMDHFLYALQLGSDIITTPYEILKTWIAKGIMLPADNYRFEQKLLKPIVYSEIDLGKKWDEYNIRHELTNKGMDRFSSDWNTLIK
ncbi:MAG TPA: transaldolase family protein [Nitrospirota bacterium]|nr:transaldolase family protein [Nitrospirota bacterium]